MSNVIIGIIGVCVLIRLALDDAPVLEPRFQEPANDSTAAAVPRAIDEVS